MEESNTNNSWVPIVFIFLMFCIFIYFTLIKDYIQNRKVKIVKIEALKGNKYALEMLRYRTFFKDEDEETIRAALNGNANALRMMGYDLKEEKK